jgi:hypothetical protein
MASGKQDNGSRNESRRDFMKGAVGTLVVGATLVGGRGKAHAQEANRRAVLPDGKAYTRPELLRRMGLDPSTPPEAWISIVKCGQNSAALKPGDAQRLVKDGKLDRKQLTRKQQQGLNLPPEKAAQQGLKIQPQSEKGLKIQPQQVEGIENEAR